MRSRFTKPIREALLTALLGAGLSLFAGCAGGVYTSGTVAYYDYDYYPAWDVYYYPHDRVYYWNDGKHWHSGRHMPEDYRFRSNEPREHLQLHSRQPWTEHRPERQEFREHYR